jgi:hypothetical protein
MMAMGRIVGFLLLAALLGIWILCALLSGVRDGLFHGAKQRRLRLKPR